MLHKKNENTQKMLKLYFNHIWLANDSILLHAELLVIWLNLISGIIWYAHSWNDSNISNIIFPPNKFHSIQFVFISTRQFVFFKNNNDRWNPQLNSPYICFPHIRFRTFLQSKTQTENENLVNVIWYTLGEKTRKHRCDFDGWNDFIFFVRFVWIQRCWEHDSGHDRLWRRKQRQCY